MHRSGTSLTASWLERCGFKLHNGNFFGADVGNPKGHFEDKDFVVLHSDAIKSESPASQGWKVHPQDFLSFSNEHLERAIKLVDQRNAKYSLWAWKDPRTVIFLEQWKKIIPSLKVLFVWRPCSEVAHSLLKRSKKSDRAVFKIKTTDSVKLWMSYNEKVCEYKEEYSDDTLLFPLEYVVHYDQNVLRIINEKFQTGLSGRPISEVYDKKLLKRSTVPLLIRLICSYYKSSNLEQNLMDLSDR